MSFAHKNEDDGTAKHATYFCGSGDVGSVGKVIGAGEEGYGVCAVEHAIEKSVCRATGKDRHVL